MEKKAEERLKILAKRKKMGFRERRKYKKLFIAHEELLLYKQVKNILRRGVIASQKRKVKELKRDLGITVIPSRHARKG